MMHRHFKGSLYRVICSARHSESEEELVVYEAVERPGVYWARPRAMFESMVEVDGQSVRRFEPVLGAQEGE